MLTSTTLVTFLLENKLVAPEAIIGGDLLVYEASRRNANYQVLSRRGPSYMLKQGLDASSAAAIALEARVCSLLHADASTGLQAYVPRLHHYYPKENLLVLELIQDASDLRGYCSRLGRFPVSIAVALADALSRLHGGAVAEAARRCEVPTLGPPWVLSLHRPGLEFFHRVSGANVGLVQTVQRYQEFCSLLETLEQEWQQTALVHFDIKGDNILLTRAGQRRKSSLKLVDWELAGVGDPCWDVGCVFGEYLWLWLQSIPVVGHDSPDKFIAFARYPLAKIQPSLRAFWQMYASRMQLAGQAEVASLGRSVRYAAARLVQTAFEQGQQVNQLSASALHLLQLSFNMLQRPQEAAVHLLGLDWQRVYAL